MNEKDVIYDYCTGCGLCHSVGKVSFTYREDGFPYPNRDDIDVELCKTICPVYENGNTSDSLWGEYIEVLNGWATDESIRHYASSGGMLTSVCIWMLNSGFVDGIIQTVASESSVYGTQTVISRTEADVKKSMGSRYSISSPLMEVFQLMEKGERYAFVGKPCDVAALRSYCNSNSDANGQIRCFLSFFCAGMPSIEAQKKLLSELGCKESECATLRYRGDGWPGFTTAQLKSGIDLKMPYSKSWGEILGRDIRSCCRFCNDGIGLAADISCGDAWYVNNENKPIFSENNGRNVIFARTKTGIDVLHNCIKSGEVICEPTDVNLLRHIQKYQYERRATMIAKVMALALAQRNLPRYSIKRMVRLAKEVSVRRQLSIFKGILIRCKKGII